ncbi:recombinase family protein [Halovulum sp. GXIMD14794]
MQGYAVEAVFPDDASGGGDFINRPGMVALLSYLDAQADKDYVVIFDDLKRFARDTEFHIKLRREFQTRGARIECLNFELDDSPEGKFVETIFAAQGELEREQNRRQVIQKMKARVENGYWVFAPPVGYKYAEDRVHGKIMVRDEPIASILAEALEGFASGHLQSQAEVKRFLEGKPALPKDTPVGEIRWQRVQRILSHLTYTAYVEAPKWGVSARRGHHEPIISLETFERIQERVQGKAKAPARKDISEDFPLRGFVLCDDCGEPMTSCWSKGRSKHYPYFDTLIERGFIHSTQQPYLGPSGIGQTGKWALEEFPTTGMKLAGKAFMRWRPPSKLRSPHNDCANPSQKMCREPK